MLLEKVTFPKISRWIKNTKNQFSKSLLGVAKNLSLCHCFQWCVNHVMQEPRVCNLCFREFLPKVFQQIWKILEQEVQQIAK